MAATAVSLSVAGKKAVQLEPDTIYRIGRKPGLEFYIADESMELAHATISLFRAGVVRLAAVVGKIWVNEQEQSFVNLSAQDASDGHIKLRFGNVEAKLEIVEAIRDQEEQEKIVDATIDSLIIPETEPPSANTTSDSCFIPETQAVGNFARPSTGSKRSLGDDLMIPETQDALAFNKFDPVANEANKQVVDDEEDCSEMGTQIRICTQDFNDFDADAIDDFDSSLILGDFPDQAPPAEPPKPVAEIENPQIGDVSDLEMSKLNWSAINSTKMDQIPSNDDENTRSTPDLFDLAVTGEDRGDTCTPDLFDLPPIPVKSTTPTQQLGGTKQLVVATIERNQDYIETQAFPLKPDPKSIPNLPETTSEKEPINQDLIETQAFPLKKLPKPTPNLPETTSEKEPINQDLIETQAFPLKKLPKPTPNLPETTSEKEPINQDLTETQAFPLKKVKKITPNLPGTSEKEPFNQDFIETQAFPLKKVPKNTPNLPISKDNEQVKQDNIEVSLFEKPKENKKNEDEDSIGPSTTGKTNSLGQDFIATQPFPGFQKRVSINNSNKENYNMNISHVTSPTGAKINQDFIETQRFVQPTHKVSIPLDVPDEIGHILKEMITGDPLPSLIDEANEEPIKFYKPYVIKDKNHNQKVCQIEGVFAKQKNKARWDQELVTERVVRSESPPATPSRKSRCLTQSPNEVSQTPATSFQQSIKSLKRLATSKDDSIAPAKKPNRQKSQEKDVQDESKRDLRLRGGSRKGQTGVRPKAKEETLEENNSTVRKAKVMIKKLKNIDIENKDKSASQKQNETISEQVEEARSVSPPPIKSKRGRRPLSKQSSEEKVLQGPSKLLEDPTGSLKRAATTKEGSSEPAKKRNFQKIEEVPEADLPKRKLRSRGEQRKDQATQEKETKRQPSAKSKVDATASKESSQEMDAKKQQILQANSNSTAREECPLEKDSKGNRNVKSKVKPSSSKGSSQENETRQSNIKSNVDATASKESSQDKDTKRQRIVKSKVNIAGSEESSQEKDSKGQHNVKSKVNSSSSKESSQEKVTERQSIVKSKVDATASKESSHEKDSKRQPNVKSKVNATTASKESSQEKESKGRKVRVSLKDQDINKEQKKSSSQTKNDEVENADRKAKPEEHPTTSGRGARVSKDAPNAKAEAKTTTQTTRRSSSIADPLQAINKYVKSKKVMGKIKISLSMCNVPALEGVFKALKNAIEVTADPEQCHVLIMDKGERTYKFLIAIAANKPILSTQWLYSLKESRSIVVHANHLFNDTKFEKLFKFNPQLVMEKPTILQNIDFMLSDGIQPNEDEMKTIIASAGGKVHQRPPPVTLDAPLYVVTNIKQAKRYLQLLRNHDNVKYIKTEGVMQTLLQHNLELLDEFQLKF